jgi:hypothetical protein
MANGKWFLTWLNCMEAALIGVAGVEFPFELDVRCCCGDASLLRPVDRINPATDVFIFKNIFEKNNR